MAASKGFFSITLTAALPLAHTVPACPSRGSFERMASCSDSSSSTKRMRKLLCIFHSLPAAGPVEGFATTNDSRRGTAEDDWSRRNDFPFGKSLAPFLLACRVLLFRSFSAGAPLSPLAPWGRGVG